MLIYVGTLASARGIQKKGSYHERPFGDSDEKRAPMELFRVVQERFVKNISSRAFCSQLQVC